MLVPSAPHGPYLRSSGRRYDKRAAPTLEGHVAPVAAGSQYLENERPKGEDPDDGTFVSNLIGNRVGRGCKVNDRTVMFGPRRSNKTTRPPSRVAFDLQDRFVDALELRPRQ